jgi:hypothetical protein
MVIGCGEEPTTPALSTSYVMVRLNGHAMPWSDPFGCCIYAAGRLELTDGRYTIRIDVFNRQTQTLNTASGEGEYRQDGTRLVFSSPLDTDRLHLHAGRLEGELLIAMVAGEAQGASDQWEAWFLPP